jgi:acetylornithine aminotransferase/acetylornithine/N-succinyldiaminopimelate aminotransferase
MLCTDEVARAMDPGLHGTTFGGGPLACAVALAVLDTIESENLLAHVRSVGAYFEDSLQQLKSRHDAIVEVRGRGLMLGVELNDIEIAKAVAAEMLAQKVIINRTSDVVLRFLPPFVIEKEHIDRAIAALDAALTEAAEPVLTGGV